MNYFTEDMGSLLRLQHCNLPATVRVHAYSGGFKEAKVAVQNFYVNPQTVNPPYFTMEWWAYPRMTITCC